MRTQTKCGEGGNRFTTSPAERLAASRAATTVAAREAKAAPAKTLTSGRSAQSLRDKARRERASLDAKALQRAALARYGAAGEVTGFKGVAPLKAAPRIGEFKPTTPADTAGVVAAVQSNAWRERRVKANWSAPHEGVAKIWNSL